MNKEVSNQYSGAKGTDQPAHYNEICLKLMFS